MNAPTCHIMDPDARLAYLTATTKARQFKGQDVLEIFNKRGKMLPFIAPVAYRAADPGLHFLQQLMDLECSMPRHPLISDALGAWLVRFLAGEQSTILTIVCPDYSWEPNSGSSLPFRYTFCELWDGIGITAHRALRQLPQLWVFLRELAAAHGVTPNVRFIVSIADNEVESEALVAQCGINAAEFLARCQRSLDALADALYERDPTMPLQPHMLTHINEPAWRAAVAASHHIMERREHFGRLVMPGNPGWQQGQWDRTLQLRRNIYSRMWPDIEPDVCLANQGREYIASGIFCDSLPNCLYFGVDNHAMELFMQGGAICNVRPVAYMIANYT